MTDKETELYQNMRFYGEMRFKQLALFLAWLTIAGTGVSQSGEKNILDGATLQLVISFASMLVTAIIWIMEISSTKYWVAHKISLTDKWPESNITWKQLNATNATVLLYLFNYVFWLYASYKWNGNCVFLTIFGIVFLLLFVKTTLNYLPLWKHKPKSTE